jgi:hypothetical protein
MITVRQIERQWNAKLYQRLFKDLISVRPEYNMRLELELGLPQAAAAVALIRLEELNQSHAAVYSTLLKALLTSQQADGGWGDPMTTAFCLRALLADSGNGASIDRALGYLSNLQKTEGIWPNVPIRRMPADPFISAFILYQLASSAAFRASVRFEDAVNWFEENENRLDHETQQLWQRASARCNLFRAMAPAQSAMWS